MLKIGELAGCAGISAKTLRHYEKIGLFKPGFREPKSAYRLYLDEQITELNKIVILKKAGFSLKEIKTLVEDGLTIHAMIDVLKKRRAQVKQEITGLTEKMEYIHSQILDLIKGGSALAPHETQQENADIGRYPAGRHYDLLATMTPDPPVLQRYMAQWDGEAFFHELGPYEGRSFLEVGIGTGRIADVVLNGGGMVTGIDPSAKSLECANAILAQHGDRLRLVNCAIEDFLEPCQYDAVYSVLTFCHIREKEKAISNIVGCLKTGGKAVLSIELEDTEYDRSIWIDGNTRYRPEYWPNDPEEIVSLLRGRGCEIIKMFDLLKTMPDEVNHSIGFPVARLITAVKG